MFASSEIFRGWRIVTGGRRHGRDRRKKDIEEVDDDLNVAENHFLDVASGEVPSKAQPVLFSHFICFVLFLFFSADL